VGRARGGVRRVGDPDACVRRVGGVGAHGSVRCGEDGAAYGCTRTV
jgi:hypothetical protein